MRMTDATFRRATLALLVGLGLLVLLSLLLGNVLAALVLGLIGAGITWTATAPKTSGGRGTGERDANP